MDLSAYYDWYWENRDDTVDHSRQGLLVEHVNPGEYVLEVDCGPGVLAKKLMDKGAKVVATDLSRVAVGRALLKGIEAIQVDLDAESLPFGEGQFDVVVSDSAVEHLFHSWAAIKECIRVLRPGGRFIILLPNIAHWRCRLWLMFGRFPYVQNSPTDETHLRFFTIGEVRTLCESAGVTVRHIDGAACLWVAGFYPALLRRRGIRQLYEWSARRYPSVFARDFILVGEKRP